MDGPFRVINTVIAHDGGAIRSIALGPNDGELLTGCQSDTPSMRHWRVSDDYKSIEEIGEAIYHDHWVTAITTLKSDPTRAVFPQGCIITGCMDSIIRIYDPTTHTLLGKLSGHTKGVISFSWTIHGQLISGSWDGTARIWDLSTQRLLTTLGPHENGVHVLGMQNGLVLTTSTGEAVNGQPANFQIRFWNPVTGAVHGESVRDHQGSIRSISRIRADRVATTSNDGTVVVRDNAGRAVRILSHPLQAEDNAPPFVLDASAIPAYSEREMNANNNTNNINNNRTCNTDSGSEREREREIVSCGEDGVVVVWRGDERVQVLPHPDTVWVVLGLPAPRRGEREREGDATLCFVSGGHDGALRFFSNGSLNALDPQSVSLSQAFLAETESAQRRKRRGPSNEEIARAPRWEDRGQHAGRAEHDVQVFNDHGRLIAAQWASGAWCVIGDVTGAPGEGDPQDKELLNGVPFDHVFPVEMDTPTGVKTLRLGHNNGENPFSAAQRFIDENGLPQYHLQEIADWIIARTASSSSSYNSAAVSTVSTHGAVHSGGGVPPPPVATPPTPQTAVLVGKFSQVIRGYSVFDELPQAPKLLAKVRELSASTYHCSEMQLQALERVVSVLMESNRYHCTELGESDVQYIALQMTTKWQSDAFIAFDLLRLIALHPQGSELLAKNRLNVLDTVWAQVFAVAAAATADSPHAVLLTALRFVANALRSENLRRALYLQPQRMCDLLCVLLPHTQHRNKLVRAAAMTVLFNYVGSKTTFKQGNIEDPHLLEKIVSAALKSAHDEQESSAVVLRALQILGSLVVYPVTSADSLRLVRGGRDALQVALSTWSSKNSADVVQVAREVLSLL